MQASYGGLIVDPLSGKSEYFGTWAPEEFADLWSENGSVKQVVAQAELAPAIFARILWGDVMLGRRVFALCRQRCCACMVDKRGVRLASIGCGVPLHLLTNNLHWLAAGRRNCEIGCTRRAKCL